VAAVKWSAPEEENTCDALMGASCSVVGAVDPPALNFQTKAARDEAFLQRYCRLSRRPYHRGEGTQRVVVSLHSSTSLTEAANIRSREAYPRFVKP
jgi:hypothetical protein